VSVDVPIRCKTKNEVIGRNEGKVEFAIWRSDENRRRRKNKSKITLTMVILAYHMTLGDPLVKENFRWL